MREGKLNKRQKLFVDTYVGNGLNGSLAYSQVYDITNLNYSKVGACTLLKIDYVNKYLTHKLNEITKELEFTKEMFISRLKKTVDLWELLSHLTLKEDKSKNEISLMKDLIETLKINNPSKNLDMIAKVQGFYSPIQQEINHNFRANFGNKEIDSDDGVFGDNNEDL